MQNESMVCGYSEECDGVRFAYISAFGLAALTGVGSNLVLLFIFATRSFNNSPPNLFPAMLAFFDALICLFYILLFVVDASVLYLKVEELFVIYHMYIVPVFVMAKISQLAIPYMLIFATVERYAWITTVLQGTCFLTPRGRRMTAVLCVVSCIGIRLPSLFGLVVDEFPDCPDFFRRLAVAPANWTQDNRLYEIFDFHVVAALQTFFPFVVLISFNVIIVRRLAQLTRENTQQLSSQTEGLVLRRSFMASAASAFSLRKMPGSVRNAVFTMVIIVTTYLISNSLHIFLSLLERSSSSLLEGEDPHVASAFYSTLGDVVSISYMVSSAIRIVVYMKCNPQVRKHVLDVLGFAPRKSASTHGSPV